MINLTKFLKHVDAVAATSTQESLAEFVHNIARSLPEEQREDFLEKLNSIGGEASVEYKKHLPEEDDTTEIRGKLERIQEELLLIEHGELCLVGNLNEEYDDWYDSSDDEFIFEDPENLVEIIEEACDLIHQCVDLELYKDCYELADMLIGLQIMVEGDYSDYAGEPLSLDDIEVNGLGSFNYKQLITDALCAAYWANPLEERPDALYRIICNSGYRDITLEEILQTGKEEFKQLPDFLSLWIEYLGARSGKDAERLLSEALALQNDSGQSLEAARKFARQHPALYEQILKQNLVNGSDEELFNIGQEALQTIQPQYRVRSRVALLTAVYAFRMGRRKEAGLCWLEAFRSDTRPVHYLRMAIEDTEFSGYREEARQIYHDCFNISGKENRYQFQTGELSENRIDRQTYFALAFLGGEFRHVVEDGMNERQPLGWSATFMKMGMGLFLLYLYQGDELSAGCRNMCYRVSQAIAFTTEAYSQGLYVRHSKDSTYLFWECFCKWKKMTPMSAAEEQWIMEKLEAWLRIRVDGIMQGNYRKYYGECAAFIAALGEVRASRGEINGKAKLMEAYRSEYSRRTAFHKELKAFGMR